MSAIIFENVQETLHISVLHYKHALNFMLYVSIEYEGIDKHYVSHQTQFTSKLFELPIEKTE